MLHSSLKEEKKDKRQQQNYLLSFLADFRFFPYIK